MGHGIAGALTDSQEERFAELLQLLPGSTDSVAVRFGAEFASSSPGTPGGARRAPPMQGSLYERTRRQGASPGPAVPALQQGRKMARLCRSNAKAAHASTPWPLPMRIDARRLTGRLARPLGPTPLAAEAQEAKLLNATWRACLAWIINALSTEPARLPISQLVQAADTKWVACAVYGGGRWGVTPRHAMVGSAIIRRPAATRAAARHAAHPLHPPPLIRPPAAVRCRLAASWPSSGRRPWWWAG